MNHSFMAAFFFKNISIFARYYTDNNEDDIEKDINEITPWKRRLNAQMSDYTMDYIGTEWYSGGQIRWKHKKLLLEADVIISKGQGNFESLVGEGFNPYYIFLCKCDLFVKRFCLERYQAVFAKEENLKFYD